MYVYIFTFSTEKGKKNIFGNSHLLLKQNKASFL